MLLKEFDQLPTNDQLEFVKKFIYDQSLSFQELRRNIHHLKWEYSQWFTTSTVLSYGLVCRAPLNATSHLGQCLSMFVYYRIEECFKIYGQFLLLCSSKKRVGEKSFISRLPNELFYKVIEFFFTK